MLRVCAWCKKIEINNQWIIPLFDKTIEEKVTHGICPSCKKKELEEHADDYSKAPL
jgi:hypothetical protein